MPSDYLFLQNDENKLSYHRISLVPELNMTTYLTYLQYIIDYRDSSINTLFNEADAPPVISFKIP